MKKLLGFAFVVAAIVGCSGGEEPAAVSPAGQTKEAAIKGGQGGAKGMSASDLTVPAGSENANLPGSKGK